jgi:4,5-DOPA dioxygenase extradiol
MFALEPGQAGPLLRQLGEHLSAQWPLPKAIAIVSPHWMTRGSAVSTVEKPKTIYDFGGFDPRLYLMQYPALGQLECAQNAIEVIANAGWSPRADDGWGLDHGAWVPLMYLYPKADVPVFQISLPVGLNLAQAFAYGQALSALREKNVLVMGSGSLTHNLSEFRGQPADAPVEPYVSEFVSWVRAKVQAGDGDALKRSFELAPHAHRAHPTDEHYLPLLVAMGAAQGSSPRVRGRLIDGGVTHGILSMDSFVFGENFGGAL